MSVRIKFGDCVPFPPGQGYFIRLVLSDNPDKPGVIVIMQGQVMLFENNEVLMMDNGATAPVDNVITGDDMSRASKLTVVYVPIENFGISRAAGQDGPLPTSLGGGRPGERRPGLIL